MLDFKSPQEMAKQLADRCRELRLLKEWSRQELAQRSGVTVASLKRFELTGEISLQRLLMVAMTLGVLQDFEPVMQAKLPTTLSEVKRLSKRRQRGKRNT